MNIFKGVYTALVTPILKNEIDFLSLQNLLSLQIEANVQGIVVGGSTGEGTLLNIGEYIQLLNFCTNFVQNKIKVIATCNTPCISKATDIINIAQEDAQVHGIMLTSPSYVKPTGGGFIEYCNKICYNTSLPIMLYNIPSRTGANLEIDTILQLMEIDNILSIKDATQDLSRILYLSLLKKKEDFTILAGDDINSLAFNANGANGVVSVASNIVPKIVKKIQDYCSANNYFLAYQQQKQLLPLYQAMSYAGNPVAIKYCLFLHKIISSNEVRLPLMSPSEEVSKSIEREMNKMCII